MPHRELRHFFACSSWPAWDQEASLDAVLEASVAELIERSGLCATSRCLLA